MGLLLRQLWVCILGSCNAGRIFHHGVLDKVIRWVNVGTVQDDDDDENGMSSEFGSTNLGLNVSLQRFITS